MTRKFDPSTADEADLALAAAAAQLRAEAEGDFSPSTRFAVFNETDGLYASPNSFPSRAAAEAFITQFKARFERQGYYASVAGRIPPPSCASPSRPP